MTTGAPPPPTRPARIRHSRLRAVLPLCVAVWVVLEIWLLALIGQAAGGFTVFLLMLAGLVAGGAVVKRAGRRAVTNLSETLQAAQRGSPPDVERRSAGNGLLMAAGLLLIVPGVLSDAVGLLLLLPPVRGLARRAAERVMRRRMPGAVPGSWGDAFQQARMQRGDGKVVRGEVIRDGHGRHDGGQPADRGRDAGPRPPIGP